MLVLVLGMIVANFDRFSKFCHCWTPQ